MANITDKISKEQFNAACNKYPANAWTKFSFRYFSTNSAQQDLYISKTVKIVLIGLFLVGLIGTILNLPRILIGIATLTFTGILLLIGILMFGAFIMNNSRIKKIRKELNITIDEYNALLLAYSS
jgi:hypothetical protein